MIPFSRGKRMLELSQKATEQKRRKQESTLHGEQNIEERPHAATPTLDISTSQFIDIPHDADLSFSVNESLSDLENEPLSSSLKVANFVLNHASFQTDVNTFEFDHREVEDVATRSMPQALDLSMTCVPGASAGASALEAKDQDVTVIPKTNDLYFVNEPLFHEVGVASVSQVDAQVVHTVPGLSSSGADVAAPLNGDAADAPEVGDVVVVAGVPGLSDVDTDVAAQSNGDAAVAHEVGDVVVVAGVPELSDVDTGGAAPLNGDAANAPEIIDIGIVAGALEGKDEDVSSLTAASSSIAKVQKTKKEKNKEGRELGQAYTGRYYDKGKKKFVEVMKGERKLGERCQCKASYYTCKSISDSDRQKSFSDVWKMTWGEKQVFVKLSVEAKDVKERRAHGEQSRRNKTLYFTLRGTKGLHRVCKQMFLNTTGLNSWWVVKTATEEQESNSTTRSVSSASASGHSMHSRSGSSTGRPFVKQFLERLPKMPAHYCRKDTSKMYLETAFRSYSDVYREYLRACTEENIPVMSMTVFTEELKGQNISIFIPRKDQCDVCCKYKQGNTSEEVYLAHIARKEAAQAEKAKDKEQYRSSRTKALCVDVQRVLLSPCLKASSLYYKTKLQVHNYTVFDLVTKDVICYVWNESEGGLTANEFASCLVSYLEKKKDSYDHVIIYSDGCTYQNRNRMLATALRHFSVKNQKTIEQKVLERGHTQMEVDSAHATIERRLKNVDIFSPLDYVQLIQAARVNPRPYEVQYLKYDFFLDFENYGDGAVKSLKPEKDANVTDICALKYSSDGAIMYKLKFSNDWVGLDLGRKNKLPSNPSQLYHNRRKIKKN